MVPVNTDESFLVTALHSAHRSGNRSGRISRLGVRPSTRYCLRPSDTVSLRSSNRHDTSTTPAVPPPVADQFEMKVGSKPPRTSLPPFNNNRPVVNRRYSVPGQQTLSQPQGSVTLLSKMAPFALPLVPQRTPRLSKGSKRSHFFTPDTPDDQPFRIHDNSQFIDRVQCPAAVHDDIVDAIGISSKRDTDPPKPIGTVGSAPSISTLLEEIIILRRLLAHTDQELADLRHQYRADSKASDDMTRTEINTLRDRVEKLEQITSASQLPAVDIGVRYPTDGLRELSGIFKMFFDTAAAAQSGDLYHGK